MIRLHKHRVFRSVLAVWLALLVLSGTALPAHASLTGKNTVKAVQEYAAYIRKTAKSSGLASVPKRPFRTRGQMELFRLISDMRLPLRQAQTLRNFGTLIFLYS